MEGQESAKPRRGLVDRLRGRWERKALEKGLSQLRSQVQAKQAIELQDRKTTNPHMTEEEQRLGVYLEEIEPQVRYAVVEMNRKGYSTYSSGFWGHNSEYQTIEGDYRLDDETANKLRSIGIEVSVTPSWKYSVQQKYGSDELLDAHIPQDAKFTTDIRFKPQVADLEVIEGRWRQIADMFPDRGSPAVNWYKEHP